MAAVAFASLAIGYSVTAMLSSIERIRSWTHLSEWGEERPNALKRLAFSFRILILPYSVAAVFFLLFIILTSESAPDVLALIMASLFVVWAVAQGRSFGAWASAQSAKGTPKSASTSGQGYIGLAVLALGVVGFSGSGNHGVCIDSQANRYRPRPTSGPVSFHRTLIAGLWVDERSDVEVTN